MALVDPNDPYAQLNPLAGYTLPDAHEDLFRQWADQVPQDQSIILPGELGKHGDVGSTTPPPPPPPPLQRLDTGLPSYDEVANANNSPASPTAEAAPAPSLASSSVDATNLNTPSSESTPHLNEVSAGGAYPQPPTPSPLAPPTPIPGSVDTFQPAAPSLSGFTPKIIQGGAPGSTPYGVPVKESDLRDEDLTPDQLYRRYLDEAHKDPLKFAKRIADYTTARNDKLAADLADNNRKLREESEAKHALFLKARDEGRAKRAKLDQDIADLGNQKIDANHWWATRTTAGKIGGWVAALVGGLVQGQTGAAHNEGLAGIQAAIDQDIEVQKANLANKRQALGEQGQSLDRTMAEQEQDEHDAEARRIASYKDVADQMITAAQNFDPRSKTAIELTQNALAMEAAGKKAADEYQQKVTAAEEKKAAKELEARKQAEVERQHQADERLRGWAQSSSDKRDQQNYKLEEKKADAAALKADAEGNYKLGEDIRKHAISVPGVRTADGQPFIAQGPDDAIEKVRGLAIGARGVVNLIDKARRIRTGYSSSVSDRKQWQELQQIWGSLTYEGKNLFDLGALSADDYKSLSKFFGAEDPTGYADIGPALMSARSYAIQKANGAIQGHATDPSSVSFDIPDPMDRKAVKAFDDTRQEAVLDFASTRHINELKAKTAYEDEHGAHTWINDRAQNYLDELIAESQNADDPQKQNVAIERLHSIANATEHQNPRLSEMARNAINGITAQSTADIANSLPSAREDIEPTVKSSSAPRAKAKESSKKETPKPPAPAPKPEDVSSRAEEPADASSGTFSSRFE